MKYDYLGVSASILSLVLASPAWSQGSGPPAATAPTGSQTTAAGNTRRLTALTNPSAAASKNTDKSGGLEEIVVTAQKRSENLQRVPITVLAIGGIALENKGVGSTADLGAVAAGVNIRINNSSFLPYIRGIGTNSTNTESPASLYIDGVYLPYSRGGLRDLNDVTQVAVLEGPQGTLFGRNSTAGVIQIKTREPTQELHYDVGTSIDNYETSHTDGYISGGIADGLAGSLSAEYGTQGKGWGNNYTTGEDTHRLSRDVDVRGKLVYDPGPNTKVTLIGEYYDQDFVGIAYEPYKGTTLAYPGQTALGSHYDSYADTNGFLRNKGYSGSLTVNQNLGFANLLSISAYQNEHSTLLFDDDLTRAPAFTVAGNQPNHVYTQELQLVSPTSGLFKWVLGAYYFNNTENSSPSVLTMRPPFTRAPLLYIRRDGTQSTESVAGFAQGTLHVLKDTDLTFGMRYTYENRDFDAAQTVGLFVYPTVLAPFMKQSQSVERPSFRVSLDHTFSPDVLGYISFNTGFKSGGFNLLAPTSKPYLPESLTAYEVGLKTQLFDRRLRLDGAAFYYDYKNIQVSQVVNNFATVSNAAKAETYGLDLNLQALVTANLQISGGASILHAEYTDYPGAQLATPSPAGAATITSFNADGKRLPFSQKFSTNLALDYDVPIEQRVHFNATGAYQGDYYLEPDNYVHQPAYFTLNTSLRWTLPGNRANITIFGKNLFNERVITAANSTANSVTVVYDDAPRSFGLALRYDY